MNLNYTDSHILWYSKSGLCEECKKKSKEADEIKGFCPSCLEKHKLVMDAIIYTREEMKTNLMLNTADTYSKIQKKVGLPSFKESVEKINELLNEDDET